MASKSNIEWTGHTWNPLAGCSVITPGCKRCYAMRLAKRLGAMGNPLYAGLTMDTGGGAVWTGEMRKAPRHTLLEPLRRKKPTTYFVNSMSDLFHESWESALNGKRFDMWAGDDEDPMQPGHPKLDWVIVGGESGGGYRYMEPEWANDIGWQCRKAGVAFFLKQMAGKKPIPSGMLVREMPVVA